MKKIIKLFIFLAILFSIFNKQIVSYAALHFFSKWIDREVIVDKFKINYTDSLIVLDKVQIKNSKEFYYNNFVEIDKIILNYNFKSLFTNLIIINNLIFENPTFFLELVEKPSVELSPFNTQKMYDDNVGGVKKIVKTGHDKIWPKKKRDVNFIISEVKINGTKVFLKTFLSKVPTEIKLPEIFYTKVGNGATDGNYMHHKDALKLIYYDLIKIIPDLELKNFLKKIYNYKSLLGELSESGAY